MANTPLTNILAAYDRLEEARDAVLDKRDAAERGEGSYAEYDELRADNNAEKAELLDSLVQLIRHTARTGGQLR